jgi:hypothetical protein
MYLQAGFIIHALLQLWIVFVSTVLIKTSFSVSNEISSVAFDDFRE